MLELPQIQFDDSQIITNVISSLAFLLFIIAFRYLMTRHVATWRIKNIEARRRWIVNIRNFSIALLLVGLLIIWAAEIRTLAISMVVVATAFVIAAKEIIACFIGGILKASNKMFEIGDRIEVQGIRGDVLDHTFTMTTLYEIGPHGRPHKYTGRVLKIPNSLFLTSPVVNETASAQYVLHTIRIPMDVQDDWKRAEQILLELAKKETNGFIDGAKKYLNIIEKKEGIEAPDVIPQVFMDIEDKDKLNLYLRIPVKTSSMGTVEQEILKSFAAEFYPSINRATR